MFMKCPLISRNACAFCGKDHEGRLRCGYATGNNVIMYMSSCPHKKMKKWQIK